MTDLARPRIQDVVEPWWIADPNAPPLCPGRLVKAFVPFPDVHTLGLVLVGRQDPKRPETGLFHIEPLKKARTSASKASLPVAAMPGDYVVQRGKVRPAVILGTGGIEVSKAVAGGATGSQRKPCLLLAPYYGADQDGRRAGFSEQFKDRIRRLEYPQFVLDSLPLPGPSESVLRLDHLLASGSDPDNYELTQYRLSDTALRVVWDWLRWFIEGVIPEAGWLDLVRQDLARIESIQ